MSKMTNKTSKQRELNDSDLDRVAGGLPAVQKVREAAARMKCGTAASTTPDTKVALGGGAPGS